MECASRDRECISFNSLLHYRNHCIEWTNVQQINKTLSKIIYP